MTTTTLLNHKDLAKYSTEKLQICIVKKIRKTNDVCEEETEVAIQMDECEMMGNKLIELSKKYRNKMMQRGPLKKKTICMVGFGT